MREKPCCASIRPLSPQPVSSQDGSRCGLHECPVFPPQGNSDDLALAAFSVLQAHTARKPNSQNGLRTAVRCALVEGRLWAVRDNVGRQNRADCCIMHIYDVKGGKCEFAAIANLLGHTPEADLRRAATTHLLSALRRSASSPKGTCQLVSEFG